MNGQMPELPPDPTITMVARIYHEANRIWCQYLEDDSQKPWNQAEDWQKESAIEGVKAFINDPSIIPEKSHQGWMDHKIMAGWKYGPVKDPEKREHPCIVPYDQLPKNKKLKDDLFLAIVGVFSKHFK